MIFRRRFRRGLRRGTDFYLEEEQTRRRAVGFGLDDYIRIKDERGNIWTGMIEPGVDSQTRYYLTDGGGNRLSGITNGSSLIFRDGSGRTWKGYRE